MEEAYPQSGYWSTWLLVELEFGILVFEERGKAEYPGKNLSEQRREQTNSTHKRRWCQDFNLGHIGGRQALSPLCHPLLPKIIFSNMFWSFKGVRRTTQGGIPDFNEGDGRMGQKSKPKKNPWTKFNPKKSHTEFPSHKNFQRALKWYNTKNTNISFKYPKKIPT